MTAHASMMSRNCSLCGSSEKTVVHEAALPEALPVEHILHTQYDAPGKAKWWRYRLVRCVKCGHYYADPVFNPDVVDASYLTQEHDNQFDIDPDILVRTHEGYARLVEPFLPPRREVQIDVGCDTGCFLRASRRLGFRQTIGIEPGKTAARRAALIPGVQIRQTLFDPKEFKNGTVQLLTMIHVLDHLSDPLQFITKLKPLMDSQGGTIMVVVHNIESLLAHVSGKHWAPLGVIHFDYFTPSTLRLLFQKAGFQDVSIFKTRNYFPLFHLIRFAPGIPSPVRRVLYNLASKPLLRSIVFGVQLGNIAAIARANP